MSEDRLKAMRLRMAIGGLILLIGGAVRWRSGSHSAMTDEG